jgi:hypothetical protein
MSPQLPSVQTRVSYHDVAARRPTHHPHTFVPSIPTGIAVNNKFEPISQVDADEQDEDSDSVDSAHSPMVEGQLPSLCSSDDRAKLTLSLQVLIEFCTLYGFDETGFDRSRTLSHWQSCSAHCGWIKFLKYKTSAFFSNYLETEPPARPFPVDDSPAFLACGRLGRWMCMIMRTPMAPGFATGILYLKKGMPRPGPDALSKALASTKKVLTTRNPGPLSDFLSRSRLIEELQRTTREIFQGQHMTEEDLLRPYAPSIRANYTDSRSDFGTLGSLYDAGLLEFQADSNAYPPYFGPNLPGSDLSRWYFQDSIVKSGGGEEIEDEDQPAYELTPGFRTMVSSRYKELYLGAAELAVEERPNVKLVALAESLKVRVISKGPVFTYFVLKPVQKFLHNVMRRQRIFTFIGETVTPEALSYLLLPRPLTEEQDKMLQLVFHSLDYESATDLLDPEVSLAIVQTICDSVFLKLPIHYRILLEPLMVSALTGHIIEGDPQLWGQLMGSIISFIILCIANATVCRISYEISESTSISLNRIPCVVNGDDGLVVASSHFSAVWQSIAASAGLKPSLGKTYTHPVYSNINSTSFQFDDGYFQLIPYVNMGLVYGLKRSKGKVDAVEQEGEMSEFSSSIGAVHHKLIESCPWNLRMAVHTLFLKKNDELLKSVFVPWYVSASLGGLGLKEIVDYSDFEQPCSLYGPSPTDLKCLRILSGLSDLIPSKIPSSQPILCRSIWSSRLPVPAANRWLSDSESAFLDLATYYLLPRLVMTAKPFSMERLRRNERAWARLRRLARQV